MSRNVVAQESPDKSFAGLLDHLTGYNRENASRIDSEPDYGATFRRTSRPPASPVPPPAAMRTVARAMLPVKEVKSGRTQAPAEAATLSYEKALRLHARKPPAQAGASAANPLTRKTSPSSAGTAAAAGNVAQAASSNAPTAGSRKEAQTPSSVRSQLSGAALNPVRTAPKPAKTDVAAPIAAKSRKASSAGSLRTGYTRAGAENGNGHAFNAKPAKSQQKRVQSEIESPQVPGVSTHTRKTSGKTSGRTANPGKSGSISASKPAAAPNRSRSRRKAESSTSQAHSAEFARSREPQRSDTAAHLAAASALEAIYTSSQLEILDPVRHDLLAQDPLSQLSPIDQRRTIVSVRLTEGEFAKLRDRAGETGISVSAYMRSCVVDADQLRAQVKYALSEMRALSAPVEANRFTALAKAGGNSTENSSSRGWFQMVLRPLTFLFGPLFPARRGA